MNDAYISTPASDASIRHGSTLESTAFYVMLATIILAPLVFLPTPYVILDAAKTFVIVIGTIISAVLYGVVAYKERQIVLPPRSITWMSILIGVSLILSAIFGIHFGKSFFGQGFELNTVSFLLALFLGALTVFTAVQRKAERASMIYVGIIVSFLILFILHGVRLLIGSDFATLGVLSTATTTLIGTWYDLGMFSIVISLIAFSALAFLPLSGRIRVVYWLLLIAGLASAFIINSWYAWTVGSLVFLGLTFGLSFLRPRQEGNVLARFFKRIAWLPLVLCLVAALFSWKGATLAGPVITKLNAEYTTLSLPWQLTLDVDSEVIKAVPLFGAGPNHFSRAYIAYKPGVINATNFWSAEFNYGFSLFSTFVATQGVVGLIVWGLFIIFLGIIIVRNFKHLPADSHARFITVSSSATAAFLWIMNLVAVPSHAMIFYTLIATALAVGASVTYGVMKPRVIAPASGSGASRSFAAALVILVVAGVVWGFMQTKDTIALAYFGSGVKQLTVNGDPLAADAAFSKAQTLNVSDIYYQARAEAGIAAARSVANSLSSTAPASTTEAALKQVTSNLNTALGYAKAAQQYDATNYYNYLSEARVSEVAASIQMENAYQNAIDAYTAAIRLNPFNPSIYLSLAQVQASQNKLDDSLQTLGAALQVKNNYLDAIFMLSQVTAAQGNLKDAIIAAKVATQINPQNSLLFFQLGLLEYNNKDYSAAAAALENAVKLQPDYANAVYFLGLSYARLNRSADAIAQFAQLAETNPDNQEVAFILSNLRAGRSPFADAKPPVTATPEKRSSLPIKEKRQ